MSRYVIVDENACWDWKTQSEKTISVPMSEVGMCDQREEGSSNDRCNASNEFESEICESIENGSRLMPM